MWSAWNAPGCEIVVKIARTENPQDLGQLSSHRIGRRFGHLYAEHLTISPICKLTSYHAGTLQFPIDSGSLQDRLSKVSARS